MNAHRTQLDKTEIKDAGPLFSWPTRVSCSSCDWFYYNPSMTPDQLRSRGRDHTRARGES